MKKKFDLKNILPPIIFLIIFVIGLEIFINIFDISRIIFPKPSSIVYETAKFFVDDLFKYSLATFFYITVGVLIAIPIAIILASIFSQYEILVKAITPIIILMIVTPMITLIPILKLWLGFNPNIRIIVVVMQAVPLVTLNTLSGFRNIEKSKLEFMRSTGATRLQVFTKVIFPNALPQVFTGIKLGCIFSTIATISSDFILSGVGIGVRIVQYSKYLMTELMFGCVLIIAIIGIILYTIVSEIEKRVIVWKK